MAESKPASGSRGAWLRKCGPLTFLALASVSAYWLGYQTWPDPEPGLVVYDSELDFGEAWEDRAFQWKFTVRNPTVNEIKVKKFWSSCSCLAVDPDSATIEPGGQVDVAARLDLSVAMQDTADSTNHLFVAEIVPTVVGQTLFQKPWAIRGRVRKAILVDPPMLNFGDRLVRGQAFPSESLVVSSHLPLQALMVKANSPLIKASIRSLSTLPHRYQLNVAPTERIAVGRHDFQLHLQPVAHDARILPVTVVPIVANVVEDIDITPSAIFFGSKMAGETARGTIALRSRSGKRYCVAKIDADSKHVTITTLAGNAADHRFDVLQYFAEGHQTATITVSVRFEDKSDPVQLRVPVNCHARHNE